MRRFRRILVGIEGQATEWFPLEEAIKLARDGSVCLRVVELVDLWALEDAEASGIYALPVENELVQKAWRDLARVESQARGAGVRVETAVLPIYGAQIGDAVADAARQWRADLIVLGANDHRGLAGLTSSSVAESIAGAAKVPVLLVPAPSLRAH